MIRNRKKYFFTNTEAEKRSGYIFKFADAISVNQEFSTVYVLKRKLKIADFNLWLPKTLSKRKRNRKLY